MKKSEKLELYTALIIQPIILFYLFLSLIYFGLDQATEPIFTLWIFSLLITFGAYFQVQKKSLFGFWMMLSGGIIVAFLSGALALVIIIYGGFRGTGVLFLIAVLIPLILSSTAVISAVKSLD
jgi:hypothetical protein